MKSIMLIVQALILLGFGLKMSFWTKRTGVTIAFLCLLFSLCILHWTVDIPQNRLTDWMGDYHSMQDIAVCLVLDVALQAAFCVMFVRRKYSVSVSMAGTWVYRILSGYPGVLLFGSIFMMQVVLLGNIPGQSFWLTAFLQGLILMLVSLLLRNGSIQLLPHAENRLELLFLVEILAGILGILCTVCGNQPL